MRTKRSRQKWWSKLSISALEGLIQINESKISAAKERIAKIDSELPTARSLETQHESLQRKIWSLESKEIDSLARSVVALFDDTKRKASIQVRDTLEAQRKDIWKTICDRKLVPKDLESERSRLVMEIQRLTALNRRNKDRIETLQRKFERAAKREAKTQVIRGLAAAHTGKARSIAVAIRRQLSKDEHCPYCMGGLGDDPQADHINPVANGGLSTAKNMVYVCRACNGLKRDLTLREFCLKHGRDRQAIESALERLGKRI